MGALRMVGINVEARCMEYIGGSKLSIFFGLRYIAAVLETIAPQHAG